MKEFDINTGDLWLEYYGSGGIERSLTIMLACGVRANPINAFLVLQEHVYAGVMTTNIYVNDKIVCSI